MTVNLTVTWRAGMGMFDHVKGMLPAPQCVGLVSSTSKRGIGK